jgi:hypothetical protein
LFPPVARRLREQEGRQRQQQQREGLVGVAVAAAGRVAATVADASGARRGD